MVDVTNYNFTYEEVVTALIRHLDVNEGLWALSAKFNFEVKNLRADASSPKMSPGFMGVMRNVSLVRVSQSIPGLTVDAAKVNPKPFDGQTRK
jgi:hypothetical protein